MNEFKTTSTSARKRDGESGKVGLAIIAWMLGVPGLIVLAILFLL